MTDSTPPNPNWFASGGDAYALYRPTYPEALPAFLASVAPDRSSAVDVGCGNGQFTCQLAEHFAAVTGVDPSADQIAHAVPHDRVRYVQAPAEETGLADGGFALIIAAQAAHWFDRPRFYAETRRIAAPDAVIALVSYGIPVLDGAPGARFEHFYRAEIGPYWPPERRLVEGGYADIDFPFAEMAWPAMEIRRDWDLAALTGYVSTWSALRRAEAAGQGGLIDLFAADMAALWGDAETTRSIRWPVTLRLGRL